MTKRETLLLKLLIVILIVTGFSLYFFTVINDIRFYKQKTAEYTEALDKLQVSGESRNSLLQEIEWYKSQPEKIQENLSLSEITAQVKSELAKNNIIPSRYQTAENAKEQTAEFVLECNPENFLAFLRNNTDSSSYFKIYYMVVKSGEKNITVVLRIKKDA